MMKNKAAFWGMLSFLSPIPMTIFAFLWDWIWYFGIVMGPLGYERIPTWSLVIGMAPLLASPTLCIFSMIYGIRKRKEKLAWLGILLSFLGVVVNGLLLFGILYMGSRY